jgi:hypothetical protein
MKINNFQEAMLKNKDVAWQIIKVFHPEYDDSFKEKLSIQTKYDWIMLNIKGARLAIEFECHLMSGDKPLHLFEKELRNNKFRSWRFVDDSKYKVEKEKEFDYLRVLYNNLVNDILNKNKIPKPTAKQMSDYYHSD